LTPWIIDASLAMTWYLDDEEDRQYGLSVLAGLTEREVRVPALFIFELSNALVMAHRRNRIASDALDAVFQKLLYGILQWIRFVLRTRCV
jgi:predicted nucleic acid-binding protein